MELTKIKCMNSVVHAMENVLKTIKKGDDHILNCFMIIRNNYSHSVESIRKLAEENRVSMRIDDASTYQNHFRDVFGFWGDNPIEFLSRRSLTEPKLDRYQFARQILRGLYSIENYPRISEPTKKNLVKCPEKLKYDLEAYPHIETYKNGDFKIEADDELLWLIKFIKDFYVEVEHWYKQQNKNYSGV